MDEKTKSETPEPVVLPQRPEDGSNAVAAPQGNSDQAAAQRLKQRLLRRSFKPSRKATLFAVLGVLLLVGANVAIVWFIINPPGKAKSITGNPKVVTDQTELDKLGVNRSPIGDSDVDLVIAPGTRFKQSVIIDKQLQLSGQLTATNANLTELQAGNTSLAQLNVNGSATVSELSIRNNFTAAGNTRLQGTVTVDRLMSVGALNVSGDLTVGGTLTTSNFSARSLTSTSTLTIGGHVITRGASPSASAGGGVGSSGTVNISGSDAAGTLVINTGGSPAGGVLVRVTFATPYGSTPRVVVSPVGRATGSLNYYVDRNANGFTISADNPVGASGYAFDFITMQ